MEKLRSLRYRKPVKEKKTSVKGKTITKSVVIVTVLVLLSRVVGFAREILLAANFGISIKADAYLMAIIIPSILYVPIGIAIQEAMIPVISKMKEDRRHAFFLVNNVLSILLLGTVILTLIVVLFTEEVVAIFAPGYEGEVLKFTIISTKIIFPGIIFVCISQMMTAILQANNIFVSSNIPFIVYNLMVATYLLVFDANIYMLSIVTLAATFMQLAVQLPAIYKINYKFRFTFQKKNKEVNRILVMLGPLILGASTQQVNMLIDRMIASNLGEGVISALNYAFRLNGTAYTVLILGLITVLYPRLAEMIGRNDNRVIALFRKTSNIILFLTYPSMIILITMSKPIVQVFFERGDFDGQATVYTSSALSFYAIGIVALGLKELLNKTFYSLNDTKTPMINSLIGIVLNIGFNLIFVQFMGFSGLALGTSMAAIVTMLLLTKALLKKGEYLDIHDTLLNNAKFFVSTIAMGVAVYSIHKILLSLINPFFALTLSIVSGFMLYTGLLFLMKQKETLFLVGRAKLFINKTLSE